MLAFVDESGDPGMKLGKGSSDYLIITMVVFDTPEAAAEVEAKMREVRQQFGWKKAHEFHFNKMSERYRKEFLEAVAAMDFRYYSMVMDKANLEHEGFKNPASLYKCTCNYLFSNGRKHLRDAIVVVDGSGSKQFKKEFTAYLRKRANEHVEGEVKLIKKVKVQDSDKNDLIQLADMCCGAVARSFTDKRDARDYRKIIRKRERYVQVWPK